MLILLTGEDGFLGKEIKKQLKINTLFKKKKNEKYIINLKNLKNIETYLKKINLI